MSLPGFDPAVDAREFVRAIVAASSGVTILASAAHAEHHARVGFFSFRTTKTCLVSTVILFFASSPRRLPLELLFVPADAQYYNGRAVRTFGLTRAHFP
jgi:hypothetical protein